MLSDKPRWPSRKPHSAPLYIELADCIVWLHDLKLSYKHREDLSGILSVSTWVTVLRHTKYQGKRFYCMAYTPSDANRKLSAVSPPCEVLSNQISHHSGQSNFLNFQLQLGQWSRAAIVTSSEFFCMLLIPVVNLLLFHPVTWRLCYSRSKSAQTLILIPWPEHAIVGNITEWWHWHNPYIFSMDNGPRTRFVWVNNANHRRKKGNCKVHSSALFSDSYGNFVSQLMKEPCLVSSESGAFNWTPSWRRWMYRE